MWSRFGVAGNSNSAAHFDGSFGDQDVTHSLQEMLSQELDFPDIRPRNIVLVWGLPAVMDLEVLRFEFLAECLHRVPDLEVVSSKVNRRTDQAEKWVRYGNSNGNPNVLICSYMLIAVRQREHARALIEIWDGNEFQTKTLRVKFSKFDDGDE